MPRWLILTLLLTACSRPPSATAVYQQAWNEFRRGNLGRAGQLVESVLAHSREPGGETLLRLRLLQCEVLLARGRAAQATELLNRIPQPPQPDLHLRWLLARADSARRTDRADQAAALLDELDRAAGPDAAADPVLQGLVLRGAMLAGAGKVDQAEAILRTAIDRAGRAGNLYQQASALVNLSYSKLLRQRFDESIALSWRALAAGEKAGALRISGLAHNHLGVDYSRLGDFEPALEHQQKAIARFREIGDVPNLLQALGGLSDIYTLSDEPAKAVAPLEEAVRMAREIDATSAARLWANSLALAWIAQGNWDEAERWNRQALALNAKLRNPGSAAFLNLATASISAGRGHTAEAVRQYRKVIAEAKGTPFLEWQARAGLATLFADEERYREANAEFERSLHLIEQVRSSLLSDQHKLTFLARLISFFQRYVDALVAQNEIGRALQVVEYSRARVLAERLGSQPRTITAVDPARFVHYARRHNQVLLSYWIAPQRSFVWVVKGTGIRCFPLPPAAEIATRIRGFRKMIEADLRDALAIPQSRRLTEILLGPVQQDLAGARGVIVVPDGDLHALNLETLPTIDGRRYWIEEAQIAVAPSLTVLTESAANPPGDSSLLLVGAPKQADPAFPELPGAEAEIRAIARQFPRSTVDVRLGPAATPESFLQAAPGRFSMIHFAAHAEANPQRPLESAVILSSDGERYKLYARDVADLDLSASLVTISGCRSAGARSYRGEGLVGFAWAFLQSGAHAVIAGLWDVSDSSSSALMEKLYAGLAGRMPATAALRAAKLSLLRSHGPFRKPFYWAPYQIYVRSAR